jgi:Cys-tRNA(Pro)/Cys-tRNA(Cys) deacylase
VTPAIRALERARVPHKVHAYRHDPASASYGLEAAHALGIPGERVFKTLLVQDVAGRFLVALVSVAGQLDLKALAFACGAKRLTLAPPHDAERATGYVIGGISPLGQKRRLPMWLDNSALSFDTVFVSAGRRGLEIELSPADLLSLTGGRTAGFTRFA